MKIGKATAISVPVVASVIGGVFGDDRDSMQARAARGMGVGTLVTAASVGVAFMGAAAAERMHAWRASDVLFDHGMYGMFTATVPLAGTLIASQDAS